MKSTLRSKGNVTTSDHPHTQPHTYTQRDKIRHEKTKKKAESHDSLLNRSRLLEKVNLEHFSLTLHYRIRRNPMSELGIKSPCVQLEKVFHLILGFWSKKEKIYTCHSSKQTIDSHNFNTYILIYVQWLSLPFSNLTEINHHGLNVQGRE